jgi:hypothetical protein
MENEDILYELRYRHYKYKKDEPAINVSKNSNESIMNILKDLRHTDPKKLDEIKFSDVICNISPVIDDETHKLTYRYEQIFINSKKKGNPNEYADRFKKFDINTIPLIEVAKYLNIKVEKSNMLRPFGMFSPIKNKITLGSDYAPTFIHELVHAVDHILPDYYYEKHYTELVAEFSTVVICKEYNIQINISYSLYYLDSYITAETKIDDLIKRVSLICEYIKICKSKMTGRVGGVVRKGGLL